MELVVGEAYVGSAGFGVVGAPGGLSQPLVQGGLSQSAVLLY